VVARNDVRIFRLKLLGIKEVHLILNARIATDPHLLNIHKLHKQAYLRKYGHNSILEPRIDKARIIQAHSFPFIPNLIVIKFRD
jgi:hypothetical protein